MATYWQLCSVVCLMFIGQVRITDAQEFSPAIDAITLDTLNERGVIGRLGVRIGQKSEVSATVVSGSSLRMKVYVGKYLLMVDEVNGDRLDIPQRFEFFVMPFSSDIRLAANEFKLFQLRHEKKATSLDSTQVADLEKGYVGSQVHLVVYEMGGFEGVPNGIDAPPIAMQGGFGFRTHLVVVEQKN